MGKNRKGLTIIELLVTISILIAATTTITVLGSRAISQTGLLSANIQATFLAKEAMEILEDSVIRDQIWIIDGENYWNIDYRGNVDKKDNANQCYEKLRINDEGFYAIGSDPWTETHFSRCVRTKEESDILEVKVEVTFDYRNDEYNVILYRVFYD